MGQYVLRFTDDAGQPLTDAGTVVVSELFSGAVVFTSPVDANGFTQAFPLLAGLLYSAATSSAVLARAALQPSDSQIITISPASAARAAAIIGTGTGTPIGVLPATEDTFVQASAATVWTIPHNLGYPPAVTTIDDVGNTIVGEIAYPSSSLVVITFSQAVAGTAYLV